MESIKSSKLYFEVYSLVIFNAIFFSSIHGFFNGIYWQGSLFLIEDNIQG